MEFGGLDAFVDDLFVRPGHRRRGLGRALLEALFGECVRRGVLAVHVETAVENAAARSLYGSFGMLDRKRLLLTASLAGGRGPVPGGFAG
jgi:ribosomal protein S18 acetylase RimI-like enzyme